MKKALLLSVLVSLVGCSVPTPTSKSQETISSKQKEIEKEKENVDICLKSLNKLRSITDTGGISYNEYSKRVLDIKPELDNAFSKLDASKHVHLEKSMIAFIEAKKYWSHCCENSDLYCSGSGYYIDEKIRPDLLSFCAKFLDAKLKYETPAFIKNKKENPFCSKDDVPLFWAYAYSELDEAKKEK